MEENYLLWQNYNKCGWMLIKTWRFPSIISRHWNDVCFVLLSSSFLNALISWLRMWKSLILLSGLSTPHFVIISQYTGWLSKILRQTRKAPIRTVLILPLAVMYVSLIVLLVWEMIVLPLNRDAMQMDVSTEDLVKIWLLPTVLCSPGMAGLLSAVRCPVEWKR